MSQLSIAVMSAATSLIVSAIVRRELVLNQGFWVVEPVLYVRLVEHGGPDSFRWFAVVAFLAAALVITWLWSTSFKPDGVTDVAIGLLAGGALANVVEIATLGAVTDFVGIRTAGIFSPGDLAMTVGFGLMPFAVYHGASHLNRSRRIGWTAAVCGLLIFLGLVVPDRRAIGYVVVIDGVVVGALWCLRRFRAAQL